MLHDRQRVEPLKGRTEAAGTLSLARGEWTPHDLRRTMATQMRETLRVSSDVVERCLNHKPQGIASVYQTGELLAERKEAFEAWGRELERLMKLDATNVAELPARTKAAA
jgi:integrase